MNSAYFSRVLGRRREADVGVAQHLDELVDGEAGRGLRREQDLGRGARVAADDLVGFLERGEDGRVRRRVRLAEARRRRQHRERRRAAHDVVGVEQRAHARILDLALMERRRREVRVDLIPAREQRDQRVGMRHRHRVAIEAERLGRAVALRRVHLHVDRRDRDLDGRDGDLVRLP